MENKIVDFRVRLRTPQMLKPWDPERPAPHFARYIELYRMRERLSPMPTEELHAVMSEAGIAWGVVCGGSFADNAHLIDEDDRGGLDGALIAGIEPRAGILRNLRELDMGRKNLFGGVNISPWIWGIPPTDRRLYPIYAFCEQHGFIAIIHASIHYNPKVPQGIGHPGHIDRIAGDFPDLRIVMSHAGNGFGTAALACAQRHRNVWLEFSALWPRYLPEATLHAANTYLKDRSLFGTDYPLVDFKPAVEAWRGAIRPENHDLFFRRNAYEVLGYRVD